MADLGVLEVAELRVWVGGRDADNSIVDHVSFSVSRGEVFGIAGESGSGKTMTALAVMGLLPPPAQASGAVRLGGSDLLRLAPPAMRKVRGRDVGMVFQNPMSSLHPLLPIGKQLTEHVRHHLAVDKRDATSRAVALLERVRIPRPRSALAAYPHHFSGGMRQRLAIAMAIACGPRLLIADEPTTALDVTVQASILKLLKELCEDTGLAVILVTHDLGVMAAVASRLAIFYAGRIAEHGSVEDVLKRSRHPYTQGLQMALPHPHLPRVALTPIKGSAANPLRRPPGCAFHPRCGYALPSCSVDVPELAEVSAGHHAACPVDPLRAP